MTRAVVLAALVWLAVAGLALAQTATLVADSVRVEAGGVLVAEGSVEVLYDGIRLSAPRLRYDQRADRLSIAGPIVLADGPSRIVLADQAELDGRLQRGILTSARLVLDQQLQLAATSLSQVGERYTRLGRTVASSCEVCADRPVPTWEIRASEVIRDRLERQLYFRDAQFRLFGVPVAYLPRLRLPDPTNTRARGVLFPTIRSSSNLGTGLKLPYFVPLGDSADITLTPYLSNRTRTLELRYRQALRFGTLRIDGAISRDDLLADELRWYVFGAARLQLPRGLELELDLEQVSDFDYLDEYDYSDVDRLTSEVRLRRARRDVLFRAALSDFETLRDAERPFEDELPDTFAEVEIERRLHVISSELRLGLDAAALRRESEADGAGRDTARIGAEALLLQPLAMGPVVGRATAGLAAASYTTRDDSDFGELSSRIAPQTAVELRLPLARSDANGARHLLEPAVHLAWSQSFGEEVPNEDSLLVELDEGNLLSLSRLPGRDRLEDGLRVGLGLDYTRLGPRGSEVGLTFGRIVRDSADEAFVQNTGLDGTESDWLAATRLRLDSGVELGSRMLFDTGLDVTSNETRIAYAGDRGLFEGSYLWLAAAPGENRLEQVNEVTFDAGYRLSRHWTGSLGARYDVDGDRTAEAEFGLEYRTECIRVDFSLSRRSGVSDSDDDVTDFGLNVNLAGFGNSAADRSYRRTCGG